MQDVDRIYVVLLQPSFASPNTRQEASADDAWNTCVEGFSQVQIAHASVKCSKPCKRSRVEHVCPASECGKAPGSRFCNAGYLRRRPRVEELLVLCAIQLYLTHDVLACTIAQHAPHSLTRLHGFGTGSN